MLSTLPRLFQTIPTPFNRHLYNKIFVLPLLPFLLAVQMELNSNHAKLALKVFEKKIYFR